MSQSHALAADEQRPEKGDRFRQRRRKWLGITGVAVVALFALGAVLLARHWPFSRHRVIADLQDDFHGTVTIARFHTTVFPHPGCVAEGVELVRSGGPSG